MPPYGAAGNNLWSKYVKQGNGIFCRKWGSLDLKSKHQLHFCIFSKTSWWSPNEQTEATICGLFRALLVPLAAKHNNDQFSSPREALLHRMWNPHWLLAIRMEYNGTNGIQARERLVKGQMPNYQTAGIITVYLHASCYMNSDCEDI